MGPVGGRNHLIGRSVAVAARWDGPWARPPAWMGSGHVRSIRRTCMQLVRSSGRAYGHVERDWAGRPLNQAAARRFLPFARSDRRRLGRSAGMPSDFSDRTDGSNGATSDRAVCMRPRRPRKNLTV